MPRLVAGAPGKRKFWHGWVDDKQLIVKFGKLGAQGEEQEKSFDTAAAAAKELAKLVKQKLAKGYADAAWKLAFEASGLELLEAVDLPPQVEDSSLARELIHSSKRAWSAAFWHGDYTFALDPCDGGYRAGLIDRSTPTPAWRPFEPAIVAQTFPSGFDSSNARFLVAAGDRAFVIDCKTHARTTVTADGDEIISAALTRDYAAILRRPSRLELYAFANGAWSLAHTLRCHRQDSLFSFGGGRGLIVGFSPGDKHFDATTGTWPHVHFLGVDGNVRLLGTFGMAITYAFEQAGRSLFKNDAFGLIEILHLDEALNRVVNQDAPHALT